MVEILAGYPAIHQTFNLVPSLVEQLEDYAAGGPAGRRGAADGRPRRGAATGLRAATRATPPRRSRRRRSPTSTGSTPSSPPRTSRPSERAFVVERMCERPDHPRARSHPRYLELAQKRQAEACKGWDACGAAFTVDELRDLQVWFNLAWCDPTLLETEPLLSLVQRGRDFREEDKQVLARGPERRPAAGSSPPTGRQPPRGQIELSTSPYFHPILPLLANTDSARVGCGDTILPHRRFAHPEDAWEQVDAGMAKHEQVFGDAAARDVVLGTVGGRGRPAPADAGRASAGPSATRRSCRAPSPGSAAAPNGPRGGRRRPYQPYLLRREEGEVAIVFRDHTLSDLVGFGYQSWDSRDAANDLLNRIRAIGAACVAAAAARRPGSGRRSDPARPAGAEAAAAAGHHRPRRRERLGVLPARRTGLPPLPLRGAGGRPGSALRDDLRALAGVSRDRRRSTGCTRAPGSAATCAPGAATRATTPPGTSSTTPATWRRAHAAHGGAGEPGRQLRPARRSRARPRPPGATSWWPRAATGSGGSASTTTPNSTTSGTSSSASISRRSTAFWASRSRSACTCPSSPRRPRPLRSCPPAIIQPTHRRAGLRRRRLGEGRHPAARLILPPCSGPRAPGSSRPVSAGDPSTSTCCSSPATGAISTGWRSTSR